MNRAISRQSGIVIVELVLAAVILLFIGGALWYANQHPSKTDQLTTVTVEPSSSISPTVSQISSIDDIDKNIRELDAESTSTLDDDLNSVDESLQNL